VPAIVIDSSIALQWVLPEAGAEAALRYVKADDVTSPDILLVETANVLAKKIRANDISGEYAVEALATVKAAVRLIHGEPLVPRALELSIALSHPVYDCVFLACAEHLNGKLATRDAPFVKRVTERGFGHLLESTP
jgi:predicted nucleic acid-binding protein